MKVLFLQKDTMVKIATMLLSSALKEDGHECELLIEAAEDDLVSAAVEMRPDLIAFSCVTGGQSWVLETAARLKRELTAPVLVGGPHATFFPEVILEPAVDIVCRGEGEEPIREIVRALAAGDTDSLAEIPNVWVERDGAVVENEVRPLWADLDTIPFPDWDLYARRYAFLVPYYQGNFPAIMSRGCPHRCSYCFNDSYQQLYKGKGRYVRREDAARAVDRLVRMRDEFHVRRFNFVDDSFADRPAWLREFAEAYRDRVGLPFICNVRADTITEETAQILADAGCYCLRMGIESGSERVRYEILDKRVSDDAIKDAVALARAHSMKISTYNIYGSPSETLDEALATFELNRDLRVTFAQCSIMQPYPGTRIRERAEEMDLMPSYDGGSSTDVGESYFVESPMKLAHKRELTNLQKLTPFCSRMRVPTSVVRRLIALPENRLYGLAFQAEYALFRFRLDRRETVPFVRFALASRAYMSHRTNGTKPDAS